MERGRCLSRREGSSDDDGGLRSLHDGLVCLARRATSVFARGAGRAPNTSHYNDPLHILHLLIQERSDDALYEGERSEVDLTSDGSRRLQERRAQSRSLPAYSWQSPRVERRRSWTGRGCSTRRKQRQRGLEGWHYGERSEKQGNEASKPHRRLCFRC